MLGCLISFLGWVLLLKGTTSLLQYLYSVFLNRGHDLVKRYGTGSWALVTGSTDGIGYCFVQALAKRGFNVVLTGRDQAKLEERVKEVQQASPKVQVKGIQVQFGDCNQPDFIAKFVQKLEGLDLSLIVNNVASIRYEQIGHLKPEDIVSTIQLNCINHTLILNEYLPRLNKRSQRSGIIDVASVLSLFPVGHIHFQSAIKAFTSALSVGVQEARMYPNVDHMSLLPGWTKTNMLKEVNLSVLTARPEEVVEGALKDLGVFRRSFGGKKHYFGGALRELLGFFLPSFLKDGVLEKVEGFLRKIETKQ